MERRWDCRRTGLNEANLKLRGPLAHLNTEYCSSPWKQKTHTVTVLKEKLGSLYCVVKYRLLLCQ